MRDESLEEFYRDKGLEDATPRGKINALKSYGIEILGSIKSNNPQEDLLIYELGYKYKTESETFNKLSGLAFIV